MLGGSSGGGGGAIPAERRCLRGGFPSPSASAPRRACAVPERCPLRPPGPAPARGKLRPAIRAPLAAPLPETRQEPPAGHTRERRSGASLQGGGGGITGARASPASQGRAGTGRSQPAAAGQSVAHVSHRRLPQAPPALLLLLLLLLPPREFVLPASSSSAGALSPPSPRLPPLLCAPLLLVLVVVVVAAPSPLPLPASRLPRSLFRQRSMWMSDRKAELSDYTLAQGPPLPCFSWPQRAGRGREGGGSPSPPPPPRLARPPARSRPAPRLLQPSGIRPAGPHSPRPLPGLAARASPLAKATSPPTLTQAGCFPASQQPLPPGHPSLTLPSPPPRTGGCGRCVYAGACEGHTRGSRKGSSPQKGGGGTATLPPPAPHGFLQNGGKQDAGAPKHHPHKERDTHRAYPPGRRRAVFAVTPCKQVSTSTLAGSAINKLTGSGRRPKQVKMMAALQRGWPGQLWWASGAPAQDPGAVPRVSGCWGKAA